MSLFFIDANVLLEFYSNEQQFQSLLEDLLVLYDDLFITEQVMMEVRRNRLKVAAAAFERVQKALAQMPGGVQMPVQLTKVDDERVKDLQSRVNGHLSELKKLRRELADVAGGSLLLVSRGQEQVSGSLGILGRLVAKAPSDAAMEAARLRKERGDPPGKPGDPLGDQISWEQIVEAYDGQQPVWIVTHDTDYFQKVDGCLLINPALYADLRRKAGGEPDVRVFDSLAAALNDYVASEDVRTEYTAKKERLKRIAEEEAEASRRREALAVQERQRNAAMAALGIAAGVGILASVLGGSGSQSQADVDFDPESEFD